MWKDANGICYLVSKDGVGRSISDKEYEYYRSNNTNLSGEYDYSPRDLSNLSDKTRRDVLDFMYQYEDVLKHSVGSTTEETLSAFSHAIELMKDTDSTYSEIKDQLSKHSRNLISKRIKNKSSNDINDIFLSLPSKE